MSALLIPALGKTAGSKDAESHGGRSFQVEGVYPRQASARSAGSPLSSPWRTTSRPVSILNR